MADRRDDLKLHTPIRQQTQGPVCKALRREHARVAISARRRLVEATARAILTGRKDTQDDMLWAAWGDANTAATEAAELLALFLRRPNLAEEFPRLVSVTESEYSDARFRKTVLEWQFAGEVGG